MRRLVVTWAVILVVCALFIAWLWWPAIGCDGQVVRGAFRLVCVK